jgi:hypothetical protein
VVLDPGRLEPCGSGDKANGSTQRHGAGDAVSGGPSMDERSGRGLAREEEILVAAGRGMQEGRAEGSWRSEGGAWARVSSVRYHKGQAGAHLRVRVHGRKLPAFSPLEVRAKGRTKKGLWTEYRPPAEKCRTAARQFLIQDAQAGLVERQLESLMVEKKLQKEEGFPERMIVMVGGR